MTRSTYTEPERIKAIALGRTMGAKRAAEKTGIPRRTISYWLRQPASSSPIIAAAEHDIATMLRHAHAEALAAVMADIHNPKARLGDKAAALRVLGEQLALAEGRATQNIETHSYTTTALDETMTAEEVAELRRWLHAVETATDEELLEAAPEIKARWKGFTDVG